MAERVAHIDAAREGLYEKVAAVSAARHEDPRMQAVLAEFLAAIDFPEQASVLEIGCGTGAVTLALAQQPNVAHAIGIDTSELFIARARKQAGKAANVSFEERDGRQTGFDAESFDIVVLHTMLCHAREPERLIDEAFRVLRRDGWLAVFDADEATVATGGHDPLQACIDVLPVQNAGLMRRVPSMIEDCGFDALSMRSYGYVEDRDGGLMVGWVERGADALVALGRIGTDLSEALRDEAKRRGASKSWFGHISFFSALGRKP